MRYTTVIWQPPITPEQQAACEAKVAELATEGIETTLTFVDEGSRQVAIRSWPDLASAEEWCAFVLGIGCSSAAIDPET
jgi:hypothetical protein